MVPLHVLIYIAGYLLRDWMDWQKMGVALLYNSCNAALFGSVYLVASNRWNTLVAKVGLYSILPFCYGINFGGEFFEAVNFLYFSREAMFHTGLFLRSIGCYGCLLYTSGIKDPLKEFAGGRTPFLYEACGIRRTPRAARRKEKNLWNL